MANFKAPLAVFFISFTLYFLFWLFLYKTGKNEFLIQSEDSIPNTYLPVSVIKDGDLYLEEYYDFFKKHWPDGDNKKAKPYYLAFNYKNRIISSFPIFNSLLSVPLYLPLAFIDIEPNSILIPIFGRISASFYVALASVFVYLSAFILLKDKKRSFLVYLSFAFGSINFALLSQTMWQHGFTSAFLALSLYLTLLDGKYLKYSGLTLSVATLIRPTSLIFALGFTVYVLLKRRKELKSFVLFALLPIPVQLWYGHSYLGSFFKHSYTSQLTNNWIAPFPEGFLGLWFSPSKGILVYSPQFIFSLVSIYLIFIKKKLIKLKPDLLFLFKIFAFCLLIFTLLMGKWVHWYGGWGFGYRMVSDTLPLLALLLVPLMMTKYWYRFRIAFYLLLTWAFFVEFMGMFFDFRHWHTIYDNGPNDTGWLWSIKDSEMSYYIKKIISKFTY